ncbi:AAA family ATPase [Pseudomonas xantholysinigenes]|uniref:AAA family ATPase n=1 Tax=Pseudomonas xantholysinigenes TaxID=2745490 RepID=A0A9E6Q0L9_9PSED|nr:AAA family ATPase [Pseudomonas xantholysinigenes]QXI40648.1 AAA family ATPase [Pseudomonas xantholysinigenes]
MKVLVLCGPESSGKSWLAGEIQAHFGGVLVGEYVRHFMEREQRDTCYADIPAIARGQLAWEDQARAQTPGLVILDTHLLSNILWSRALFDDCPAWLEQTLKTRHYDLHLLLRPEGVEWVGDGLRCQPRLEERQQFFDDTLQWLQRQHQPYQVLDGDWAQRGAAALAAVARLLDGQAPACATEC